MTEVGKILHELDYIDNQVERFDKLAMHLYTIPIDERYELLSALMWFCGVMDKDGTVKNDYRHRIKYYDKLLAKINNKQ